MKRCLAKILYPLFTLGNFLMYQWRTRKLDTFRKGLCNTARKDLLLRWHDAGVVCWLKSQALLTKWERAVVLLSVMSHRRGHYHADILGNWVFLRK